MENPDLLFSIIFEQEPISPINAYKARAIRTKYGKITAMLYLEGKFVKYKKEFLKQVKQIKRTNTNPVCPDPIRIEAQLYFGTRRRKDLQNALKLELDALNGIVYHDDSQISEINTKKFYDPSRPRCEIRVYKIPNSTGETIS
jgi:Holliday junction resolvase RusA-like endonuclease